MVPQPAKDIDDCTLVSAELGNERKDGGKKSPACKQKTHGDGGKNMCRRSIYGRAHRMISSQSFNCASSNSDRTASSDHDPKQYWYGPFFIICRT